MIKVGDRLVEWTEGMTVSELILQLGYDFPYFYVTINGTVVPTARHRMEPVPEGAEVEIHPIVAGG